MELFHQALGSNCIQVSDDFDNWIKVQDTLYMDDNDKIKLGTTSTDFVLYSDGTNGIIDVATSLRLGNNVTNYMSVSSTGTLEPVGTATYKANGGNAGMLE